jgi:hypothetical protein
MPDSKESPDPLAQLGQQALAAQTVALDLSARLGLLAVMATMVWLDLLVPPDRKESPVQRALRDQPARMERLVRRGIPEPLARQALRVL